MAKRGRRHRRTSITFDQHIDAMIDGIAPVFKLLEDMEMLDRYTDSIESSISFEVQNHFHESLDAAAAVNADSGRSYMHLYKWGQGMEAGDDHARLVRMVFTPTSGGRFHGTIVYLEDDSGGRSVDEDGDFYYTEHLFPEHAQVMEEFGGAWIRPKGDTPLTFKKEGEAGLQRRNAPIWITYERQSRTLHTFFVEYFESGAVNQPIFKAANEVEEANVKMLRMMASAVDFQPTKKVAAGKMSTGGFRYRNKLYSLSDFQRAVRGPDSKKEAQNAMNAFLSHLRGMSPTTIDEVL